jgi:hypothetical protein
LNTEFDALRQRAKENRDAAIKQANSDYKRTLAQITALQNAMTGNRPYRAWNGTPSHPNVMTLREAIVAVLGDRKLTRTEVVVGVIELGYRTAMPRRDFVKRVRRMMQLDGRFRRIGTDAEHQLIKQVAKPRVGTWAREVLVNAAKRKAAQA